MSTCNTKPFRYKQRTWAADIFNWDADDFHQYAPSDYTLYNADCMDIYKEIEPNSVHLILTDPPYGITRNGWDTADFRAQIEQTWAQWRRILSPKGVVVVTAASPFDKIMACSNIRMFKYEWVWNKNKATGHLNANRCPMKAHENILVFYDSSPVYHPQKTLGHEPMNGVNCCDQVSTGKLRNYGHHYTKGNAGGSTLRTARTVLNIPVHNNDAKDKWHPTQKPIKLMEYFVRTYTDKGHVVFDPFMGSGTTGIAALKCDRQFIGVELDTGYFNKAQQRLDIGNG